MTPKITVSNKFFRRSSGAHSDHFTTFQGYWQSLSRREDQEGHPVTNAKSPMLNTQLSFRSSHGTTETTLVVLTTFLYQ